QFAFEKEKLKKGLALINRTQAYAIGFSKIFKENFKGEFHELTFTCSDEIDSTFMAKIKEIDPDFILIPSYQVESPTIISRLLPDFTEQVVHGPDKWGAGRLFHNLLKEIRYPFKGFYVLHYSPIRDQKGNAMFRKLLKKDPELAKFDPAAMLAPIAIGF